MTYEQKERVIEISNTLNGRTYFVPSSVATQRNLEDIKEYLQQQSGIPVSSQLLLTKSGSEVNSNLLLPVNRLFVIDKRDTETNVTNTNGLVMMKLPTSGQFLSRASNSLIYNSVKDYNHRLKFHVRDMKAMLEYSYKKVELYSQHVSEQQRECEGNQATIHFLNKEISKKLLTNIEWKESSEKLLEESNDKIEKMDATLKKLESIPLDKALCQPNLQNLLDVMNNSNNIITPVACSAKDIYRQFRESKERLNIEFLKILSQADDLENRRKLLEVEPLVDFEKQWIEISDIKKELIVLTKECDRLLNVIQSGHDLDLEDNASILPSPPEQEQQIQVIQELDNRLTKVMDSTTIMTKMVLKKLKMVVLVWEDVLQLQDFSKVNYDKSYHQHKKLLTSICYIHHLPRTYSICIEEMKRRLSWGKKYYQALEDIQDKFKQVTEYEIGKRFKFEQKYVNYIPKAIFPGLKSPLQIPGIYIDDFDTELPMLDCDADSTLSFSQAHTSESRKLDEEIITLRKEKEKQAILHTSGDIPGSILVLRNREDFEELYTTKMKNGPENNSTKTYSDSQFVFVEDEKQSLEKQISSLKQDLQYSQCETADIQMRLEVAQKTVSVTTQKYRNIQTQKLALEKEKEEIHSKLCLAIEEIQMLRLYLEGERNQAHNSLVEVMKQVGVIQTNLEKAMVSKDVIQAENLRLQALVNQLEEEKCQIKTEHENLSQEMNQLTINCKQTKNQQEEIYQQITKHTETVRLLEEEKLELQMSKAKIEIEKQNLDTAKTKVEIEKLDLESTMTKIEFQKKTLEDENNSLKDKQKRFAEFYLLNHQKLSDVNQRNKILEQEITQLKLSNSKLCGNPSLDSSVNAQTAQETPCISLGSFVYGQTVMAQEKHGVYELVKASKGSPHYIVNPSSIEGIKERNIIFGQVLYIEDKQTVKLGSPNPYQLPIGSEYYCVYITINPLLDS